VEPLARSAAPADLLVAALSYEAHGVYNEALRLYERLAELVPSEGNFQRALASYYERAGLLEQAKAAAAKAKKLLNGT
jgi:tetratricopeptide (TPR) repeat protein